MRILVFMLAIAVCGCANLRPTIPSFSTVSPSVKAEPLNSTDELPRQDTAKACIATAESLEQAGHDREAIQLYQKARRIDPQLIDYSRRLAGLHDRADQPADASREYQSALQLTPNDADLLNDFGYFQLRQGDLPGSEQTLRKSLAIQDGHQHARSNLAINLARQGRLSESYELFASVVGPAAAHYNLGVVLAKQGQREEARQALQESLRLNPQLRQAEVFLAGLKG